MKRRPPRANSLGHLKCRVIVRAVIDYFNLHLVRAGVLFEYAPQSFFQIVCPRIVRRYHHRPEGTVLVDRQYADWRRFETTGDGSRSKHRHVENYANASLAAAWQRPQVASWRNRTTAAPEQDSAEFHTTPEPRLSMRLT